MRMQDNCPILVKPKMLARVLCILRLLIRPVAAVVGLHGRGINLNIRILPRSLPL